MMVFTCSSQMRLDRSTRVDRFLHWGALLVVLCTIQHLPARDLSQPSSPQSAAFARYIASLEGRNPFTIAGAVGVLVEASVPQLYKDAALLAIRRTGESETSEYLVLGMEGDGAVLDEVTARYFALEREMESWPLSATLITPTNYNFHFRGEVKTGRDRAYAYDITPKKSRAGMVKGQIWIDAESGAELMVTGVLAKAPSVGGSVRFVRELKLDQSGYARVTHLSFAIPILGNSELTITEFPLPVTPDSQAGAAQAYKQ